MINNLDGKSKKELLKIVQIQMDEYQKLQQANDENQSLIGLLEVEVWRSKQEVIDEAIQVAQTVLTYDEKYKKKPSINVGDFIVELKNYARK